MSIKQLFVPTLTSGAIYELTGVLVISVDKEFTYKDRITNKQAKARTFTIEYAVEVGGMTEKVPLDITVFRDGYKDYKRLKVKEGSFVNLRGKARTKKGDSVTFTSLVIDQPNRINIATAI